MNFPEHGANPTYLYDLFQIETPQEIYDFSVNVNPFEPPYEGLDYQKHLHTWLSEYPDPHSTLLKRRISEVDNTPLENLFIGNGAAQCIFLLAQYFKGKTVGVIGPTFVEYEKASRLFGSAVKEFVLSHELGWAIELDQVRSLLEEVDVLYICNPNNPTGTVIDKDNMKEIIQLAKKANTYLVIDEAFYDFSSIPCTVVQEVSQHDHVIVLRSLTKMYKLAGIRIGYVAAPPTIIETITSFSAPWSVNRIAQELALHVLSNQSYADGIRGRIDEERNRVKNELRDIGFHTSNSTVNFYLLSTDHPNKENLEQLIQYLLKNGIVPRHTYNFKGLEGNFLRLAVKDVDSNNKLIQHLKGWKEQ
jgi:threonine-phosphate decarboxylase